MLRNLVKETANNPGTGSSVTLGGAVAGYKTFTNEFPDGAQAYYFITDGTQHEAQLGTLSYGPPAVLSRGTPLWTSAGAPFSRLNFAGAVSVFCALPANRTIWGDTNTTWDARTGKLRNLGRATDPSDAVRRDQLGWEQITQSVNGGQNTSIFFQLPAEYERFRLEWMDWSSVSNAWGFARFATNGSTTVTLGLTYGYNMQFLYSNPDLWTERVDSDYIRLMNFTAGGTPTMGYLEFARGSVTRMVYQSSYVTDNFAHGAAWGGGYFNGRATGIQLAFSGGSNSQSHRMKLLGSRA